MVARFALLMLAFVAAPLAATAQTAGDTGVYFPDANWQHKTPAESGFNPVLLEQAVAFAVSRETKAPLRRGDPMKRRDSSGLSAARRSVPRE